MPRTKLTSSSLRMMSDSDLRSLERISPGMTFGTMKSELKSIYSAVDRMDKGTATERDFRGVDEFGYAYAGYDDFWSPYQRRNYKLALSVLKDDISNLSRRTNKARMKWVIKTGVKSEIARRKRRG